MTATLYWKLSAIEHWEHLAAETWKQQVQQITRWTKGQSARKVVQVAMLAQALRLRGCVEDSPESSTVGQDPWTQMLMTLIVLVVLGACNFLYGHWRVISEIFARRGRKRRREPEIPVSEPEIPASEMNVETTESEGPAGEPASASTGPVPPSTSPPRGPPPRAPQFSPIPIDPPPRWDPWLPEWFLYFMLGRVNRRMERRGRQMDHNTLRRYNHRRDILEMQL